MKIVEREHIDIDKWDQLVGSQKESTCFSLSWYMDAVAENWCVMVNDDYTNGIALPYSKRAGVDVLYTPIFGMYSEVFGVELSDSGVASIRDRFKVIEFSSKENVFGATETRKYQLISDFENHKFGSQAKRSGKKAEKEFTCELKEDFSSIYMRIKAELTNKFKGIDETTIKRLETLFDQAKAHNVMRAFELNDSLGGVVCFEWNGRLLYVKGAVDEDAKRNGGMYLAMITAINYAKENGLIFDFGGSNVEGVQKFNHNLGGQDHEYFVHVENNGPAWFKLARNLKARLMGN